MRGIDSEIVLQLQFIARAAWTGQSDSEIHYLIMDDSVAACGYTIRIGTINPRQFMHDSHSTKEKQD